MRVGIIGAPVDLGADRRGVDMGSSAIRYAGLEVRLRDAGHDVRDFGNIPAAVAESSDKSPSNLKYLRPILTMSEHIAAAIETCLDDGRLPLALGGDHSLSLGSVTGLTCSRRVGIIWLDAHGDFNTPDSSPSGNIHGMVLAALAGYGDARLTDFGGRSPKVEPRNIAMIGLRELDPGERTLIRSSGVQAFTMHDVDRMGLHDIVELALARMDRDLDGIHVSLDLDVVDPLQAPGVGTPVLGGLSYRETHFALELVAASEKLTSMDIVEVNPVLDEHNETARLAVEFILSALGKRIL